MTYSKMILVGLLIALCLWRIESELSDINSTLKDINDSMYEEEEEDEEEDEKEELEPNNIVELVGEDENGNGIYRFK